MRTEGDGGEEDLWISGDVGGEIISDDIRLLLDGFGDDDASEESQEQEQDEEKLE